MIIWCDVIGYKGLYQASNTGIIRRNGKYLKPHLHKDGYLRVALCIDGKQKTTLVHRIVYQSFHILKMGLDVDHIDNNKINNNIENLQQITRRLNTSKDKKNKTSQYTGVSISKSGKWEAYIRGVNNKKLRLGTFATELEAHVAYQNKLRNFSFSTAFSFA